MNKKTIDQASDRDLAGSLASLRRAAARARQVASQTGTALILLHGDKIERVTVAGHVSTSITTSKKNAR